MRLLLFLRRLSSFFLVLIVCLLFCFLSSFRFLSFLLCSLFHLSVLLKLFLLFVLLSELQNHVLNFLLWLSLLRNLMFFHIISAVDLIKQSFSVSLLRIGSLLLLSLFRFLLFLLILLLVLNLLLNIFCLSLRFFLRNFFLLLNLDFLVNFALLILVLTFLHILSGFLFWKILLRVLLCPFFRDISGSFLEFLEFFYFLIINFRLLFLVIIKSLQKAQSLCFFWWQVFLTVSSQNWEIILVKILIVIVDSLLSVLPTIFVSSLSVLIFSILGPSLFSVLSLSLLVKLEKELFHDFNYLMVSVDIFL